MKVMFAIILVPDGTAYRKISDLSEGITAKYRIRTSRRYKKIPFHLSLFFQSKKIDDKDVRKITSRLKGECMKTKPFEVKIDGFGWYVARARNSTSYYVCLNVTSDRHLNDLYRVISSAVSEYVDVKFNKFVPHITLIGDGLDMETFHRIKNEYENAEFNKRFAVKSVVIGVQKGLNAAWKFKKIRFKPSIRQVRSMTA